MRQSRNAKPGNKKRPKPSLRTSGDAFFKQKAINAFRAFQDEPYLEPISELGFCFVKTTLGVLQVDIGWLLMLIAGILQSHSHLLEQDTVEIEMTDDVLDATVEVLKSVPRYIEADLLGMYGEAGFLVRAKALKNTRHLDKPLTHEQALRILLNTGEKREIVNVKFLGDLLAAWPQALLWPQVLDAFMTTVSERGHVGTKPWRKFIERHFDKKPKRGRRSEELYDTLFKKRLENPGLSYGKLAREVAKVKNIEFTLAREQLKAAIAYRRKKQLASSDPRNAGLA